MESSHLQGVERQNAALAVGRRRKELHTDGRTSLGNNYMAPDQEREEGEVDGCHWGA